jgi:hypothetical protein
MIRERGSLKVKISGDAGSLAGNLHDDEEAGAVDRLLEGYRL